VISVLSTSSNICRVLRTEQVLQRTKDIVASQVPENRREEIKRYLELFGYNSEHSVLQFYVAGYFGRTHIPQREMIRRERAASRYRGRTFTVLGTTHDPDIAKTLIAPRKKTADPSPNYIGYLFKPRNKQHKAPHELLPLDFTPTNLNYPSDWKAMFATSGYLITMHVPSFFAAKKNYLLRELRREKGSNVKEPWMLLDRLEKFAARQAGKVEDSAEN
jgi:hypothetical protein